MCNLPWVSLDHVEKAVDEVERAVLGVAWDGDERRGEGGEEAVQRLPTPTQHRSM